MYGIYLDLIFFFKWVNIICFFDRDFDILFLLCVFIKSFMVYKITI